MESRPTLKNQYVKDERQEKTNAVITRGYNSGHLLSSSSISIYSSSSSDILKASPTPEHGFAAKPISAPIETPTMDLPNSIGHLEFTVLTPVNQMYLEALEYHTNRFIKR